MARVVKRRSERVYLATKCGKFLDPHTDASYTPEALERFVEASLRNTGLETLDLIQLHCPPTEVYYRPEIFELFDRLREQGKIRCLGVSVEKVEQALKAIEYDNVATVQIIFNMFRQRPAELFFPEAARRDVGILARVPLASGLLAGRYDAGTAFAEGDHRFFNREGAVFDKGETFSGVPLELGLQAVEEIRGLFPEHDSLAPIALRWILDHPQVSTVIPGASSPEQVSTNLEAVALSAIPTRERQAIDQIYEKRIRALVHHLW